MTTSTKTQQFYGEYINPTIDQYSPQKENPLVLMAQACNNIGKELSITLKQSSSPPLLSKIRKSNSPQEVKKSLKRMASTTCSSSPPPSKKILLPQIASYPPSSFMFDSLFYYHLNKTFALPTFDLSLLSRSPLNYSAFSSQPQQSPYLMDSILSSPFVCNWMDSSIPDKFCGKRFTNNIHLLEHLCTEHTSISPIKSLYPSYYPSTSVEKL